MGNRQDYFKKCLLPLRETGTKNSIYCIIKYINENEVLSSEAFIKRIQQVSPTYRSTQNPSFSAIYQWFHWILLLVTVTGSFGTFTDSLLERVEKYSHNLHAVAEQICLALKTDLFNSPHYSRPLCRNQ